MADDRGPLNSGISRWLLDSTDTIVGPRWYRAFESKEIVGSCRRMGCDGLMVAAPTHDEESKVWYGASCLSCGYEVAVRSDRPLLRRSSRHAEMPDGAWSQRVSHLAKLAEFDKRAA